MSLTRFGKIAIAAGSLCVAALLGSAAPASAAWRPHHGGQGYHGGHHYAPRFAHARPVYRTGYRYRRPFYRARPIYRPVYSSYGPRCVIRRQWVNTFHGPQLVRRRVCRY